MAQVKGASVTARVRFIRERFGEDGYKRLLAALSPEHRATLSARVLPHAWVTYELFVDLVVTADKLFGAGDFMLCYEMGRFAAEVNLPTLYRIFYQLADPNFIFSRAARVWEVHYDSGRLKPVRESDRAVSLTIEDFAHPHRAHCLSVLGWASRSVELSGAELARIEERSCRVLGGATCELALVWK